MAHVQAHLNEEFGKDDDGEELASLIILPSTSLRGGWVLSKAGPIHKIFY